MVLLAAFLTQIGALETAPVLIAVFTAFLTMEGVKYLLVSRRQARAAGARATAGAEPAARVDLGAAALCTPAGRRRTSGRAAGGAARRRGG
jgi:hypothetical protein